MLSIQLSCIEQWSLGPILPRLNIFVNLKVIFNQKHHKAMAMYMGIGVKNAQIRKEIILPV